MSAPKKATKKTQKPGHPADEPVASHISRCGDGLEQFTGELADAIDDLEVAVFDANGPKNDRIDAAIVDLRRLRVALRSLAEETMGIEKELRP
jgi:hypothetical protein